MFRLKILPGLFHGVPLLQSSSVLNPSPQCVPGVGTRTQSSVGRNSWQSSSRCQPNRPPFCLHPLRGCAVPSTPAKVFQSMKKGMNHPEILGMTCDFDPQNLATCEKKQNPSLNSFQYRPTWCTCPMSWQFSGKIQRPMAMTLHEQKFTKCRWELFRGALLRVALPCTSKTHPQSK